MTKTPNTFGRPFFWNVKFLSVALGGSLTMTLVASFAPQSAQLAVLGSFASVIGGLLLTFMDREDEREQRRAEAIERLSVPLRLAQEADLFAHYVALSKSLIQLAGQSDPILREIAALKLASVVRQMEPIASGVVVFSGTETWRTVYEKILVSPDIRLYRSAAWVRNKHYWQDEPGRQSLQANYDAVFNGKVIERAVILRDDLWPKTHLLPTSEILEWIENQHINGIWLMLVRESAIEAEPDLLCDFGIYGERAVGTQELDERSRTIRFTLSFDQTQVRLALDRWQRLSLYTTSYQRLLDQMPEAP